MSGFRAVVLYVCTLAGEMKPGRVQSLTTTNLVGWLVGWFRHHYFTTKSLISDVTISDVFFILL